MRAYYFDDIPGDQRLPHDSGKAVPTEVLTSIGVLHWNIPIDQNGAWEQEIDKVASKRGYKNRDVINVSKEGLGDLYEPKIKSFFEEHMHEDEEIRFILADSGFFDVREHPTEAWIRVHLTPGDLLVLPPGIYHRFTLDETNRIKAMRLFKDEPKWTPYNRSAGTDANPYRTTYLEEVVGLKINPVTVV